MLCAYERKLFLVFNFWNSLYWRNGLMNCADRDRDGDDRRQGGLLGARLSTADLRRNNLKEPSLEGANLAPRAKLFRNYLRAGLRDRKESGSAPRKRCRFPGDVDKAVPYVMASVFLGAILGSGALIFVVISLLLF